MLSIDGIMSVGVHVGNSDLVAEFVYEDTEQLVDLISRVKGMTAVENVLWSEEVYLFAGKEESRTSVLKRIINSKLSKQRNELWKGRKEKILEDKHTHQYQFLTLHN